MAITIAIDLDETLVHSVGAWNQIFEETFRKLSRASGIDIDTIKRICREYRLELMKHSSPKAFDWNHILEYLSNVLGVNVHVEFEAEAIKVARRSKLADGAVDVLRELRKRGFRIVISTNGNWKYQKYIVEYHGLLEFVDEVRASDLVGCLKNSREFFNGIDISVGDHPIFDVHYPIIFGLKAVLVKRPNWTPRSDIAEVLGIKRIEKPHATITNLRELIQVLDDLLEIHNHI